MSRHSTNAMVIAPAYAAIARRLGLDADAIFTHPQIRVWRTLPERENATLDTVNEDGRPIRLHIKRFAPIHRSRHSKTPADIEAAAIQLLTDHQIPTVPLVAWGHLTDGRSFIMTQDLAGHAPADQWADSEAKFEKLIQPVAHLVAQLHTAGLHHRDLYLCHIFIAEAADGLSLRLIDAGRVRHLPRWPMRRRWIIKDLAQLWFSTLALPAGDTQRRRLIEQYADECGIENPAQLLSSIARKSRQIARHDAKLRQRQPNRNISLNLPTHE